MSMGIISIPSMVLTMVYTGVYRADNAAVIGRVHSLSIYLVQERKRYNGIFIELILTAALF